MTSPATQAALAASMRELAGRARRAGHAISRARGEARAGALEHAAEGLGREGAAVLAANALDLEAARAAGLAPALLDRLALDPARMAAMARSLREVAALADPVGEVVREYRRPNGLVVRRVRIPLGVVLIIYEARPGVTAEAGALCLRSGNAAILRGGSEAARTNRELARVLREGLRSEGLPEDAVQTIPTTDRSALDHLLVLDTLIDLVVPRGGESLVRTVVERSRIPVVKHYKGVCHVYVDRAADPDKAERIAVNAKVQRPGVCNAMETLLVHRGRTADLLPRLGEALRERGVEVRGCPETVRRLPWAVPATEADWPAEYLDLILAVRVVGSLEEAVDHIQTYGSRHTEAIVTEDPAAAREFLDRVHSSVVLVNASTRFNDGGELGLGAEVGISTSPIHCFGPMGLEGLTALKYQVLGDGQVRE
ncbi:MAG: glutamate-5-semialdehyde dehydrogenase [Planctomycetes bacterium]|nr:glutamate-5-semialdehyde dehydrogenase [Planctomycetota bacterium]